MSLLKKQLFAIENLINRGMSTFKNIENTGLLLVFGKFSPGFQNILQAFKVHTFGSIFSLKLSLR